MSKFQSIDQISRGGLRVHFLILFVLIALALVLKQWLYRDVVDQYCCLGGNNLNTLPLSEFWRLLLPYDGSGAVFYHWSTSGFAVGEIVRRLVGLHNANLIFIGIAMCSAYWCGLNFYKKILPATVLAFLIGFGTHLNYIYYHNHIGIFHLYVSYVLLNLAFSYRLIFNEAISVGDKLGFFATGALVILFSEIWINYFVFLLASIAFLGFISFKHEDSRLFGRLKSVSFIVLLLMFFYLPIRLSYPAHLSTPGGEEEMIFTYPYMILMLEDYLVNLFTFLHAALTSFVPPFLTFSNSLVLVGAEEIVAQQNGYHPIGTHLVPINHLFMWRFIAGGVSFAFFYLLIRNLLKAWKTSDLLAIFIVLLCLLVLFGFSSHTLIKFRPYNSAPFLTYKCITSIVGVYLLASALISVVSESRSRLLSYGVCSLLVVIVLLNALTRPHYENTAYTETKLWMGTPYLDYKF